MIERPNCCESPDLRVISQVFEPPGPERAVEQCQRCGQYWQFDRLEQMNFRGADDDVRMWYTQLSPAQAQQLLSD